MILLYVLAAVFIAVAGVPLSKKDVGSSGYDYKLPATSYGVPSGSVGASSEDYRISTSSPLGTYDATTASPLPAVTDASLQQSYATSTLSPLLYQNVAGPGFQLPVHDFTSFTGGLQSFGNAPQSFGNVPQGFGNAAQTFGNAAPGGNAFGGGLYFGEAQDFGQQINPQLVSIGINGNQGLLNAQQNLPSAFIPNVQNLADSNVQNRYNIDEANQGESEDGVEPDIEVSRHLYFFSSVDDIPAPRQRINLPRAPQKQNLKVLFIKAPAIVTPPPITIPAQKQNEEKTVVYVLVKKPEEPAPIEIETPSTTPPSKPEVYFIKYNTQQEAEEAVSKIQKQQKEHNDIQDTELISTRFSQELPAIDDQGASVNLAGSLITTTVSPLGYVDLSQGSSFTPESNGEQAAVFNSPSLYTKSSVSTSSFPANLNSYDAKNVKALSESFGGPISSNLESSSSNSADISSVKLGGTSSNDITPHSTYGVPSKRGIHRFRF